MRRLDTLPSTDIVLPEQMRNGRLRLDDSKWPDRDFTVHIEKSEKGDWVQARFSDLPSVEAIVYGGTVIFSLSSSQELVKAFFQTGSTPTQQLKRFL